MKKTLICLFTFVLIFSLVGCGSKEKAGEALAEKILEKTTGSKVDIDKDTIKIKGKDGETMTIGGTEWPESKLAENIPKFKNGKIVSVMEMEDSVIINLEKVKKDDFTQYLEQIKKDYKEEAYEMNSSGTITYGAGNKADIGVQIFYGDDILSISVFKIPE